MWTTQSLEKVKSYFQCPILFGEVACKKVSNLQPELSSASKDLNKRLYKNKILENNYIKKIDSKLAGKITKPVNITTNFQFFLNLESYKQVKDWKMKNKIIFG